MKRVKVDETIKEIAESKDVLEGLAGRPIEGFSFPYGAYNKKLMGIAREAGYRFACTIACGLNEVSDSGCFSIKRTEISGFDDMDRFKRKLNGEYDWLGSLGMGV